MILKQLYEQQDALAQAILEDMYHGESFTNQEREEKAIQDIKWTILFIIEGFRVNNLTIMNDLFAWLKRLFVGLSISETHVDLLYQSTKTVLHKTFSHQELDNYLNQIDLRNVTDTDTRIENPYQNEKEQYKQALLESNRNAAKNTIDQLVETGVPIHNIYLYIFQETMYDIGLLWQDGIINVGREHYATAVTQYLMSSLYPYVFNDTTSKHKRMIACAVGSELHELGIRMVADLFELNGWDTHYLGANLPHNELIAFANEHKPHIIALSITMPYHISILQETIDAIRRHKELSGVKIMVGGRPFKNNPTLIDSVGADLYASNALEGIDLANQLFQ